MFKNLCKLGSYSLKFRYLFPYTKTTDVRQKCLEFKVNRLTYCASGKHFKYIKFIPITVIGRVTLCLSILHWLGFEKDDEEKESELIMTLKRAILATQRDELDKAEQMLHLALRLAQQEQNTQGVLYCYDLMANLAFDRLQLEKAGKLFVVVMQMLFQAGASADDLKIIHVSLKLARISHLLAQGEKAELGYQWCLEQVSNRKNHDPDAHLLFGVINDWYAQFLLDNGQVEKSLKHLQEAYNICCDVKGNETEQSMLLLNDLGTTTWRAGDMGNAERYFKEALDIGTKLEDKSHVGVIKANLGLIYLERGIISEAKKTCQDALNIGIKFKNTESREQANYCFEQIKVKLENK